MSNRFTFYSTLAHSLIVFILIGIFTSNRDTCIFLLISLGGSLVTAYLWGYIHPRIINNIGGKYYRVVMIGEFFILANIIYLFGSLADLVPTYSSFMIESSIIGVITYNLSKRIYIKEINNLNNLIKKSKK